MTPGVTVFTARSPRVVTARRLHRRRERDATGLFLAEGPQAVREAAGHVVELFGTADALATHADVVAAAGDARISTVTDPGLAALAETVNPQGLVAVCRHLDVGLDMALVKQPALIAVLVEVRDPGNAGTVMRTADAAGAGAVVFAGAAVDPYNGKCVRASAGSLFHLDVVRAAEPLAAVAALRTAGYTLLAADGYGPVPLNDAPLDPPTAWLFGSEAHGLPEEIDADIRVRVPIYGRAESLNLAAAAAVCLYASARTNRIEELPQ